MSWCVLDNLCFCYCVESLIDFNKGTDSLAEVTDLNADIPQEGAAHHLSHHHGFSGCTLDRYISMANPD